MDSERYQLAKQLFAQALDLPADQRAQFLSLHTAQDSQLRELLDTLLLNDSAPHAFVAEQLADGGARLLAQDMAADLRPETHSPAEPLPSAIGRYRVIRLIGRGGMGAVYEAEQDHPQRRVALKVIRSDAPSRQLFKRFQYETQILARLRHPGIAQIYDAGTAQMAGGAQPFFAMEYVDGQRLTEYAARHALTTAQRLELLARVCDAIHHAHQKAVIHRDLKPGNILVDDSGQPKVLDFGIARLTDGDAQVTTMHTMAGQLIGTLPYMSPEQVKGDSQTVDVRSDVYALGVVGFELLAGIAPFNVIGKSVPEAVRIISEDDASRLGSVHRALRGDIDVIFERALAKDPARRYQSASELAADIRRHLKAEPIAARRDSSWYVLTKTFSRHKLVGVLVMAFSVTLLAATIALSLMYREQTLARERAEKSALESTLVNTFLNEMLTAGNPRAGNLPSMTVREVLDLAAQQLDRSPLTDAPEVEAAIRTTIGHTFGTLAQFEAAEHHLRKAVELNRASVGDTPVLAKSNRLLAEMLLSTNRLDEATTLLLEAEAIYVAAGQAYIPDYASLLNDLSLLYQRRNDLSRAESAARDVLALRRQILEPAHPSLAISLNNLGTILRRRGQTDEAEQLYREALDINRRYYGNESVDVANVLSNLSMLRAYRGDLAEAESFQREALDTRRKLLGRRHPKVATSLNGLAGILQKREQFAAAEALFRKSLDIRREHYGADHPRVALVGYNLVICLSKQGKHEEARPLARQVCAGFRRHMPNTADDLAAALGALGLILTELNELDEAETVLRESIALRSTMEVPPHLLIAYSQSTLGQCLLRAQRCTEAQEMLDQAAATIRDTQPPDHPQSVLLEARLRELRKVCTP